MEIKTSYYYEEGPWISYADGHLDIKEFRKEALQDSHVKSIIADHDEYSEELLVLRHGYIRKMSNREALECVGDLDVSMWEECGKDDDGAQPITAIYWEYQG